MRMSAGGKWLLLLVSIAFVQADEKVKFAPRPAATYPTHQTNDKVTVAAVPYDKPDLAKTAFGKVNPYEHGILPVLLVIQNDSNQTLRVDNLQATYIGPDRSKVEATPARDVPYLQGPERPDFGPRPIPIPKRKKKNPLASVEIDTRAFAARMLPPGESAHGFLYFQTGHRTGSKLYLSGLKEAQSGKDLFYFEIPLDAPGQ